MTAREERRFKDIVYGYYRVNARSLPWRTTKNPYRILVSEIMLQQTQVDRVAPFYRTFIKKFPDICTLAAAPLKEVLILWQGLGYNRRAKLLKRCAEVICKEHGGRVPKDFESLRLLPAIGPYTAGAILAFAYNVAHPIIETNIRTAYLHHFFKGETDVADARIYPLIEATLDLKDPRTWYWALMDYGAYLKKEIGNENKRSRSYVRQSRFKGSNREIRGAILRLLAARGVQKEASFHVLGMETVRVKNQLGALRKEGMIVREKGMWALAS